MKNRHIKKAAVLGSGIMGSRIAALLAGVGIPTYLLDIVPRELDEKDVKKGLTRESPAFRNKLAQLGIQGTIGASPPAMFVADDAKLITPGNFEDHLSWLSDADWIIEGVVENLAIKKELLRKAEPFIKPDAIISTNTSGISIDKISGDLSQHNKTRFLGTHFFNPPRHMKLLEIIPGSHTDKDLVAFMADFCQRGLGKSVVFAKDTPNFIANRIGAHGFAGIMRTLVEDGYTIEEADAITGPPMGKPRSASFRTSDIVGLDTLLSVIKNVYDNAEDEDERQQFVVPDFVKKMVEKGLLGDKTKQGFYKKVAGPEGSQIWALDYNTMDYVPQRKPALPILDELKKGDSKASLRELVYSEERAGLLAWKTLKKTLLYCAAKVPEIADDIVTVDRAMRWGFNWELGPFETWDVIGLRKSVERMKKEGETIPEKIERMLAAGQDHFYETRTGGSYYYDFVEASYVKITEKPQIIVLPSLKERTKLIKSNAGASLIDMGDGVACLEFHSRSNAIDADVIQMLGDSVTEVEENFEGLVIGNQGPNFCVGADLRQVYPSAQNKDWKNLELAVKTLQQACMRIKYCHKPVIAAPFRMTLGGGCEICLATSQIVAHTECYMGQVELGVGLIPGAGGNKELFFRATDWLPKELPPIAGGGKPDLTPHVAKAFQLIAMARVSTCAQEAKELGFLMPRDRIVMNYDHLLYQAKKAVLALEEADYVPPRRRNEIRVPGRTGRAVLEIFVYLMREALFITDYDVSIAKTLAHVLAGGDVDLNTLVTEEYLLDIEREAFLSLCGEDKTQARMKHMLDTNRPLRN
ncbi:MAG: 3-hydroxyacyl-CoA dehydrogenase [Chloroflexi bacterium]|nr:MAG: 3-hydroxyacyl-CoA dehydrogenase [Chloroflexota bacterium]